jgi:hypothetical protein
VPSLGHVHPVNGGAVDHAGTTVLAPGHVRMLFALVSVEELCVGDLALTLDITIDRSCYALRCLRPLLTISSGRDPDGDGR